MKMCLEYLFAFVVLAILCHMPLPTTDQKDDVSPQKSDGLPHDLALELENIAFSIFTMYESIDDKQSILQMNKRRIICMYGRIIDKLAKSR